jgi:hypothetical protein
MDGEFLIKLAASFVVGGVWIALVTVAAEKYGSRLGGLIGGLPSTAAVSLLFIGVTQSPGAGSEAAAVLPLAMVASGVFVIIYLASIRRGFALAYVASLGGWFATAFCVAAIGEIDYLVLLGIWLGATVLFYLVAEKWMRIPSTSRVKVIYSARMLALRACFSGAVVAFAVLMGKLGGPLYGGIFAAFPAVFTSTLYITYRTGGAGFSRAVAKSVMISGMINVTVFSSLIKYLYPAVGLALGTIIALGFSLISGVLTHRLVTSRMA